MDSTEMYALLKKCGAIQEGHFLLTSGLHSGLYVEKFNVLQHPMYTEQLCAEIVRRFQNDKVQVVVGPMTGGIILSHEVGKQLGCRALFTERENGVMCLRRGFKIAEGERVLVVEDVVTTGGSVMEVFQAIEHGKPNIIGVGLLVERSRQDIDFGARKEVLLKLDIPSYSKAECPYCRLGSSLLKPGSKTVF